MEGLEGIEIQLKRIVQQQGSVASTKTVAIKDQFDFYRNDILQSPKHKKLCARQKIKDINVAIFKEGFTKVKETLINLERQDQIVITLTSTISDDGNGKLFNRVIESYSNIDQSSSSEIPPLPKDLEINLTLTYFPQEFPTEEEEEENVADRKFKRTTVSLEDFWQKLHKIKSKFPNRKKIVLITANGILFVWRMLYSYLIHSMDEIGRKAVDYIKLSKSIVLCDLYDIFHSVKPSHGDEQRKNMENYSDYFSRSQHEEGVEDEDEKSAEEGEERKHRKKPPEDQEHIVGLIFYTIVLCDLTDSLDKSFISGQNMFSAVKENSFEKGNKQNGYSKLGLWSIISHWKARSKRRGTSPEKDLMEGRTLMASLPQVGRKYTHILDIVIRCSEKDDKMNFSYKLTAHANKNVLYDSEKGQEEIQKSHKWILSLPRILELDENLKFNYPVLFASSVIDIMKYIRMNARNLKLDIPKPGLREIKKKPSIKSSVKYLIRFECIYDIPMKVASRRGKKMVSISTPRTVPVGDLLNEQFVKKYEDNAPYQSLHWIRMFGIQLERELEYREDILKLELPKLKDFGIVDVILSVSDDVLCPIFTTRARLPDVPFFQIARLLNTYENQMVKSYEVRKKMVIRNWLASARYRGFKTLNYTPVVIHVTSNANELRFIGIKHPEKLNVKDSQKNKSFISISYLYKLNRGKKGDTNGDQFEIIQKRRVIEKNSSVKDVQKLILSIMEDVEEKDKVVFFVPFPYVQTLMYLPKTLPETTEKCVFCDIGDMFTPANVGYNENLFYINYFGNYNNEINTSTEILNLMILFDYVNPSLDKINNTQVYDVSDPLTKKVCSIQEKIYNGKYKNYMDIKTFLFMNEESNFMLTRSQEAMEMIHDYTTIDNSRSISKRKEIEGEGEEEEEGEEEDEEEERPRVMEPNMSVDTNKKTGRTYKKPTGFTNYMLDATKDPDHIFEFILDASDDNVSWLYINHEQTKDNFSFLGEWKIVSHTEDDSIWKLKIVPLNKYNNIYCRYVYSVLMVLNMIYRERLRLKKEQMTLSQPIGSMVLEIMPVSNATPVAFGSLIYQEFVNSLEDKISITEMGCVRNLGLALARKMEKLLSVSVGVNLLIYLNLKQKSRVLSLRRLRF